MKEVKKYGENGVRTCKDKRERELKSKGLKEKVVLEFRKSAEVFRAKGVKSFCAKRIKLYYYPIYSSNICTFQLLHIQLFMKNQILFCVKHTYNKFVVTNFDTKNARRRLQSDKDVNMHTYTMTMNTYIIPNTLS